jgi:hypothetical protein
MSIAHTLSLMIHVTDIVPPFFPYISMHLASHHCMAAPWVGLHGGHQTTEGAMVRVCLCLPSFRPANSVSGVCEFQNQPKNTLLSKLFLTIISIQGCLQYTSSAHAYKEDACAILTGDSTILGSAALGEAVDAMVELYFFAFSCTSSFMAIYCNAPGYKTTYERARGEMVPYTENLLSGPQAKMYSS